MLQENQVLSKFDSIVKGFSGEDRIALCHDLDADGVSSGALAYLAITYLRGKKPDLLITQQFKTVELLPKSLSLLKKAKITKLVTVDSAFDQKPESIAAAEKICAKVLIIDHHKDYGLKTGGKTFVIKPQFVSEIEPSMYPCAKFVFDLFSRHVNLAKHSWIACAGLMGDNQLAQWKEFVEQAALEHNTSVDDIWKVTKIISAVETLAPAKLQKLLLLVVSAKHPRDVFESEFSKHVSKLDSQAEKLMAKFKKERVVFGPQEIVWFEFKSKSDIKSVLINRVSNDFFPDKTVIVVQDKGDRFLYFSARRQDFKVKTNELLENAVKGFKNAGAGGHVPASAGRVMKKDFREFKKRVLAALSE